VRGRRAGRLPSPVVAAALLLCATPSAAGAVSAAEVEARVRRTVVEHLASGHLPEDLVDADALAAEARRRSEGAGSTVGLDDWLARELRRAEWAFAPTDARPDPATRYGLPFDPAFPRFLQNTDTHDDPSLRHALDFVLPVGTPVRAARDGVVARVVDGFSKGGRDRALARSANAVHVLHDDGTFASYVHLSLGIPVEEGQRVARGQRIGSSGNTGYSGAPHLHFAVSHNGLDGPRSIPVRFGAQGSAGFVPKLATWVGFPPRPTVELALYSDGALVRPGSVVSARSGERARIRVEVRTAGGQTRDVTAHPRLQLVSMTPWNLDVVGPGEVVLRPMDQFPSEWGGDFEVASVGVFFLNGDEREIGLGQIEFQLTDRLRNP
jgi:murein DD-endopeptidase MepM/ murein hydrolase activator NlpD